MALKDIAKQSIKQAVKRMTTSEMAQDLARMKAVQELKVKPPSDNVANVRDANFSHPRTIGNQTVNIKDLTGGVRMSDPKEVQRVKALADKIASPEGYISRIIVDHNNNVVEGQHRLEALRQLGVKDVPVYKIEDLAETMPVDRMKSAITAVGNIHPDHVHQLTQRALEDISEGGIKGARELDYGAFQKHYDAALDAAGKTEAPAYNEISGMVSKMGEEGRSPIVPAPNRWFLQPDKFPNQQKLIERVLQKTGKSREDFPSGAFIDPRTGEVLDSRIMDDLGVVIDPNTNRPMMSSKGESGIEQLDPKTGAFTKSNLVRKGLFKPEGGDPLLNDLSFLATIEKGDVGHKYGLATEYASPTELFNTGTGSNPTLRPRSRGDLFGIGEVVGKASVGRSEPHDVYEKLFVAPKGSDVQGVKLSKANGGAITEGGAVHLAGGGLKGYIKEPLKQAAKRIMPKTSFEMAHDLARMRASLPIEKGGLGLPINNTSEDRARAMGFDVNAYHATDADITKFDNAKLGSNTSYNTGNDTEAVKSAMRGHWFSDRDLTNKDPRGYMFGDVVYPVKLANHKKINDKEFGSESYIVKDPDQIRSTNAAFDPFRRDAATAAAMGVAAPDLLAKEPEKKADGGVLHLAGKGPQQLVKGVIKQAINRYLPNVHYADPLVPPTMRFSEALGNAGAEGKILNFTETDRSRVHGPNRGGAGFSTLQHYSDPHTKANTVWAFGNKSVASKKINQNDPENVIWTTYAGSPQQHKSNSVVVKDAIDTLQEANRKGEIHPEQVNLINERINQSLNQNGNPLFSERFDITDPKAMDYATTFDRRAAISDALLGVGVKKPMISKDFKEANPGVIWKDASNINGILTRETDPAFLNASTNDVGPHLFFMDNNIIHRPDLNEAFPYQVTGSDSGMRFELAPFRSAALDFINKKGYGPNDTINAWAMSRGVPQQFVSDKYLLGLQKQGYKEGGQVSDDAIKVEMWDKALRKAGGSNQSDFRYPQWDEGSLKQLNGQPEYYEHEEDPTAEELKRASHAAFQLPPARPRMMSEPFQKPKEEPIYQTVIPYNPTPRQMIADKVEKGVRALGSPNPSARYVTQGLMGTNEHGFGLIDSIPFIGPTLGGQETVSDTSNSLRKGDYLDAALNAGIGLGFALPGGVATLQALKSRIKKPTRAIHSAVTGKEYRVPIEEKANGGPILGEIDDRTPEEIENASHAAFKLPKARPRMMAEPFQKPKEEPTYQTATAYDPTIRQRLAGVVEKGLKSVSPKPRARALTENLIGTNEHGFGAADFVPYLGSTMQAQETGRDIKKSVNEGDYVGAAIDAIVGGGFALPGAISTAKALKPTLKSLGPKAGQMAENYLIKSGMMPQVVKREGGNWIGGAEKKIRSLKSKSNISDSTSPEELQSLGYTPEQIQEIKNTQAVNKFIDKNMMNYVKKQMATPSDPVRLGIEARVNKAQDILNQKLQNNLQAREQKVLDAKAAGADPADIANLERDAFRYQQQIHQEYQDAVQSAGYVPPRELSRFEQLHNEMSRSEAGYPKEGMATTEPSKQWESLTDYNVQSAPVSEVALEKHRHPTRRKLGEVEDYPWLNKLNPEDKIHYLRGSPRESLGFSHMLDVLKEKVASGEIKPESLNNMSMDNLVHLTGKYDQELAAKMNAERASAREGLPVHKEYPEGYKWIELNKPGSFAAESQAMGHSVRGYEPPVGHPDWIEGSDVHGNLDYGHGGWEGIKSGRAKVYSLVDPKGAPHATIEVGKTDPSQKYIEEQPPEIQDEFKRRFDNWIYNIDYRPNPEEIRNHTQYLFNDMGIPTANQITQIKGKLNAAPKEEYQPYVQDFVKSGNWSDVGDFNNTGLYHVDKPEAIQKYGSPYLNQQEFDEFSPSLYKAPEKKEGGEIERPPIYHAESGVAPFGIRHSGEGVKGRGWFGVLPNQEGGISTEISAESNGHEYPLITPSLTKEQLNLLLSGEKPTPEIYKAAEDWANLRRGKGQSPFASPSDLRFALPKKMGGQINHDAMLVELLNKGKRYG